MRNTKFRSSRLPNSDRWKKPFRPAFVDSDFILPATLTSALTLVIICAKGTLSTKESIMNTMIRLLFKEYFSTHHLAALKRGAQEIDLTCSKDSLHVGLITTWLPHDLFSHITVNQFLVLTEVCS